MSEDPPTPAPPENAPAQQLPSPTPAPQHVVPPHLAGPYYPNDDERLVGMLIHLVAVLSGFVGPLVLWLVRKDSSKFIDHNGKEAINFQLTIYLYSFTIFVLGIIIALGSSGAVLFVTAPLALLLPIFALVCEIRSCVKAHRGYWIRYPLTIRFLR